MSDNEEIIEKTYEGYIQHMSARKDGRFTVLTMSIYVEEPVVVLNMKHAKVITSV